MCICSSIKKQIQNLFNCRDFLSYWSKWKFWLRYQQDQDFTSIVNQCSTCNCKVYVTLKQFQVGMWSVLSESNLSIRHTGPSSMRALTSHSEGSRGFHFSNSILSNACVGSFICAHGLLNAQSVVIFDVISALQKKNGNSFCRQQKWTKTLTWNMPVWIYFGDNFGR